MSKNQNTDSTTHGNPGGSFYRGWSHSGIALARHVNRSIYSRRTSYIGSDQAAYGYGSTAGGTSLEDIQAIGTATGVVLGAVGETRYGKHPLLRDIVGKPFGSAIAVTMGAMSVHEAATDERDDTDPGEEAAAVAGQIIGGALGAFMGGGTPASFGFSIVGGAIGGELAREVYKSFDPLVIDLDGDGVETVSVADSAVFFDLDGDGLKQLSGWVSADDGLLVMDLDGNGQIDDITEVFSSRFDLGGSNGFGALAGLDKNFDGVVDISDAAFADLRVWRDMDQDGKTDAGELFSLSDLGIKSIDLAHTESRAQLDSGHVLLREGAYTKTDGSKGIIADLGFPGDLNQVVSVASFIDGLLYTLQSDSVRVVITNKNGADVDLNALNSNYAAGGAGDDTITGTTGDDTLNGGGGNDTLIGGDGNDVLNGGAGADRMNGGAGNDAFNIDADDEINGGAGRDIVFVRNNHGVTLNMTAASVEEFWGANGKDIITASGNTSVTIAGAGGDDILRAGGGNDQISGGDGNDRLNSGAGDDVLVGGDGDDKINGGAGRDTAVYLRNRSEYKITHNADGTMTVHHYNANGEVDDEDTLKNVEILMFLDETVKLDDINKAPVATNDKFELTTAPQLVIAAGSFLANDLDADADVLALESIGRPNVGTARLNDDGDVVIDVPKGYTGPVRFEYVVSDGSGGRSTATAEITVRPVVKPSDPLAEYQWHLPYIGATRAWNDYTGRGVRVAVFDEGIDYLHPDIAPNYDGSNDQDFVDGDGDPMPTGNAEGHGTFIAGLIAGARNGQGVVGVAYGATLISLRRGFNGSGLRNQDVNGVRRFVDFDVVNNSWGPVTRYVNSNPTALAALEKAADDGRYGLGTVMVFSAGNDRRDGGDANDVGYKNSRHVITVAAAQVLDGAGGFSSPGAAILVTAPGQDIVATDRLGDAGYSDSSTDVLGADYAIGRGTSYSAPVVSGVVALMLEANPNLGYRDVQEILAYSATQNDIANTETWDFNAAGDWNGGGLHTSRDHGFGMVNAYNAVRLAESWLAGGRAAATRQNEGSVSAQRAPRRAIPDNGVMADSVTLSDDIKIDNMEVTINLGHSNIGDLVITLVGPNGQRSVLADRPGKAPDDDSDRGDSGDSIAWTFKTTQFWGMNSGGEWRIEIADRASGHAGVLNSWRLTAFGGDDNGDDVYVYTDEYARYVSGADAARRRLNDEDGGTDTINASAVSGDVFIDLSGQAASSIAFNRLDIGPGIENAIAGDGDDILLGNDADNLLWGGRGDDTFTGGAGADTINGGAGEDTAYYNNAEEGAGIDLETGGFAGEAAGDTFVAVENVVGSGHDDTIRGDGADNEISGGAGDDVIDGRGGDDEIYGGAGDDTLSGGAGFDTAFYGGDAADYDIDINRRTGRTSVRDKREGAADGTDTLTGVERLRFADNYMIISNNAAPETGADAADAVEDTSVIISAADLLANDSDVDGDELTLAYVGGAVNGSAALNADGDVVFTPAADFSGDASFEYTVVDGRGGETLQTVTVTVEAQNDAPEAVDSAAGLPDGGSVSGQLSARDSEDAAEDLTYTLEDGPEHGSVTVNADGTYEYVSDGSGAGSDSFTFRVTDSGGLESTASVEIDLAPSPVFETDIVVGGGKRSIGADLARSSAPRTAALTDGTYVTVWSEEGTDGSDHGVFAQRFSAGGNPLGEAFQVNEWHVDYQYQPSVAAAPDGGFIVAWTSEGQDGGEPGLSGVYARRFGPGGAPAGGEFLINTETEGRQKTPSVSVSAGGGFAVSWESWDQDGDSYGVYMQRFDADGERRGGETQVNTFTEGYQGFSDAAALAGGGYAVTWMSLGQDGGAHGVYVQTFDDNGRKTGPERQVNEFTEYSQTRPKIAALPDGGFVVLFDDGGNQPRPGSGFDIGGRVFGSDGQPKGGHFRANVNDYKGGQRAVSVTVLPEEGEILAVWHSQDVGKLRGQRFDLNGAPRGGVFDIADAPDGLSALPDVAALNGVGFTVSWQQADAAGGTAPVYTKVFRSGAGAASASIAWHGGAGGDAFAGGDGDDVLSGYGGDDHLSGGGGDDRLDGGAGADVMDGGEGTDTVSYAGSAQAVTVNLAEGTGEGGDAEGDALASVENVTGSAGDDTLTGGAGDNVLEGGAGADVMDGGGGADTASYAGSAEAVTVNLAEGTGAGGDAEGDTFTSVENITGSAGDDTLTGDAEDNVLEGGAGADTINGGAGSDTVAYTNSWEGVNIDLAAGTGAGGTAEGDTLSAVENVTGSRHDDTFTGNEADNVFDGGAGDDTAVYAGSVFDYQVRRTDGGYTVTGLDPEQDGGAGTDTLKSVETLKFDDFSFTLSDENINPSAQDDRFKTAEDVALRLSAADLTGNDLDIDGDALTITALGAVTGGRAVLNDDGSIDFTPYEETSGEARIEYTVSDGRGGTDTAVSYIDVISVNDAPVVKPKAYGMREDGWLSIPLSYLLSGASDVEGDTLVLQEVGGAVNGSAEIDGNGNVRFTSDKDFFGEASFTYTVSDGNGGTATETFTITVDPVEDAPNAENDRFEAQEDTQIILSPEQILGNDSDPDGDALRLVSVFNPDGGRAVINDDGNVVFTPFSESSGTARFSYIVEDSKGNRSTAVT